MQYVTLTTRRLSQWAFLSTLLWLTSIADHHLFFCVFRGHKRKLDETRDEDNLGADNDEDGGSSKDSNEGSSSEADEMAAALDLELNDFM